MKTPSKWKYSSRRWTLKSNPAIYLTGGSRGYILYGPTFAHAFGKTEADKLDAMRHGERVSTASTKPTGEQK